MYIGPSFKCTVSRTRRKARYETIEEAWSAAFKCFVLYGHKLTPYKCSFRNRYETILNYGPNKNPWSWIPMGRKKIIIRKLWHRRQICEGWHLTSHTCHQLNP